MHARAEGAVGRERLACNREFTDEERLELGGRRRGDCCAPNSAECGECGGQQGEDAHRAVREMPTGACVGFYVHLRGGCRNCEVRQYDPCVFELRVEWFLASLCTSSRFSPTRYAHSHVWIIIC